MTKYECEGQLSIFDYLSPAQEYYFDTGKTTYWQDSQNKPYQWWKNAEGMRKDDTKQLRVRRSTEHL